MKLQAWLDREDLTYAWLARKLGVYPSTVSRLAQGISRPSMLVAERIEAATRGAVCMADWKEEGETK